MVTQRLFAILCLAALTAGAAHADMWLESAIDLGVHFGPAGNNPMNVVSDDAYAYIGGYNGSGVDRDISILKISLSDPNDAVVLSSATQTVNYGRFYDGLVIRNGVLYALCDRPLGSGTCNLRAIDAATDTLVPTFDGDLGNGNGILSGSNFPVPCASPFPGGGLAYDPGFGGQDSGLSILPYGAGRRALLEINSGITLYDTSDGIAITDISGTCTVSDQSAWRDHIYDASGNAWGRRSNQVQGAIRNSPNSTNAWVHLTDELNTDGTPKPGCGDGRPIALRLAATVIGQHLELIPAASGATDQDILIFNDRAVGSPGQLFENVVKTVTLTGALPNPAFVLRDADGAPLTLPPGVALYDFYYLAVSDRLLVLDFSNRLLLVFGSTPPVQVCTGDLDCNGQVDFGDINPFVLFLSNFAQWETTYAGCNPLNGDINSDGTYGQGSFGDITPFVSLLTSSPLPINCP